MIYKTTDKVKKQLCMAVVDNLKPFKEHKFIITKKF
jgi:hypothetical protein